VSEELATKEKVVGLKQTRRAVAAGQASKVFLGRDADPRLTEPLQAMCQRSGIAVDHERTMAELGKACAVAVGTAACALLGK